jgi:integrase
VRNRGTERQPRWFAAYYVTIDGKRREISKGPFTRKAEAEQWVKDELRRRDEGTSGDPRRRKLTVAELLAEWLNGRGNLGSNTRGEYQRIIDTRIVPHIGHHRVLDLRPGHVTAMLEALRQPGANRQGTTRVATGDRALVPTRRQTGLSETSLQHTFGVLRTCLAWAVKQGDVPRNVCDAVDRPARKRAKPNVWDGAELAKFLAVAEQDRLAALWRLAAFTGARRSELLGLHWESVDLKEGTVRIERRALRIGYGMVEAEGTKTEAGTRTIDLDPATTTALKVWAGAQRKERVRWGAAWRGGLPGKSGPVFTAEDGSPVKADHVQTRFARLVRDAKVKPIRFHDLRHSHISILLDAGEPMFDIARRAGHASVQMIISTYGHPLDGRGKRTAATFAAAVEGER